MSNPNYGPSSSETAPVETLLEKTQQEIDAVEKELRSLSATKDAIFNPDKLDNEEDEDIQDILGNLNTRHFSALEFHHETEKYDTDSDASTNEIFLNRTYRQAIMRTAQKFGLLGHSIPNPDTDFEKKLSFSSNPEYFDEEVSAIVIPGAAALANYERFYHATKAIEIGAIKTDTIVFAGCTRPTSERERETLRAYGYGCGNSEFELGLQVIDDLAGGFIDGTKEESETTVQFNGDEYPVKVVSGKILIDGKEIKVKVVESPFDKKRKLADGKPATRALTEETFVSVVAALGMDLTDKTICIVSHDAWKPGQGLAGELIFGAQNGAKVICSGPEDVERLYYNELGELDARRAEAVVDELTKYYIKLAAIKEYLQKNPKPRH